MNDHHTKKEIDDISGIETTGHEWDGLKELNNPLPRWWVWVFVILVLVVCWLARRRRGAHGACAGFVLDIGIVSTYARARCIHTQKTIYHTL